jgi:hypothetical protein
MAQVVGTRWTWEDVVRNEKALIAVYEEDMLSAGEDGQRGLYRELRGARDDAKRRLAAAERELKGN